MWSHAPGGEVELAMGMAVKEAAGSSTRLTTCTTELQTGMSATRTVALLAGPLKVTPPTVDTVSV